MNAGCRDRSEWSYENCSLDPVRQCLVCAVRIPVGAVGNHLKNSSLVQQLQIKYQILNIVDLPKRENEIE